MRLVTLRSARPNQYGDYVTETIEWESSDTAGWYGTPINHPKDGIQFYRSDMWIAHSYPGEVPHG
jgi:hypothetical protein